jgi:hypothetical protein
MQAGRWLGQENGQAGRALPGEKRKGRPDQFLGLNTIQRKNRLPTKSKITKGLCKFCQIRSPQKLNKFQTSLEERESIAGSSNFLVCPKQENQPGATWRCCITQRNGKARKVPGQKSISFMV